MGDHVSTKNLLILTLILMLATDTNTNTTINTNTCSNNTNTITNCLVRMGADGADSAGHFAPPETK